MSENIQKKVLSFGEIISARTSIQIVLLLTAFALAYGGVISGFLRTWLSRDDFSHGFIVPLVSLYFVWNKRSQLMQHPLDPRLITGSACLVASGMVLIVGTLGGIDTAKQISILMVMPALVLLLAGPGHLKMLALPLAYLVLMNPILGDLIGPFRWPMQLLAAGTAAHVLGFLGIPVFHHSCYLELPNQTLEIASACSGLNYTVAIVAVALPLAYITQKTLTRKVIVVLAGILIGIAANLLRVVIVAVWAYTHPGEEIHGPLHIFQGFSVSVLGFALLFLGVWLFGKASYPREATTTSENQGMGHRISGFTYSNKEWFVSVVLLLSVGAFLKLYGSVPVEITVDLKELPVKMGEWTTTALPPSPLFQIDGADSQIIRGYRSHSGSEIALQIAYFSSQGEQKKMIDYRFALMKNRSERLLLRTAGVKVGTADMNVDSNNQALVYWYRVNDKIGTDISHVKYLIAREAIVHRHTNGAVVFIWANMRSEDNKQAVLDELAGFADQLYPLLDAYLPEREIG